MRPGVVGGTTGRVDLPHELATVLHRVETDHDDLMRALWKEQSKVEQLTAIVKDMHGVLVKLYSPDPQGPFLPPFPDSILDQSPDSAESAAPGILVTSPTDPSPPVNSGIHAILGGSQHPQWGNPPHGQHLSTISPSSSPTTSEFPSHQKTRLSGTSVGPSAPGLRHAPPSRMNIPALPRFDSGPASAGSQPRSASLTGRPSRKLSLPSQGGNPSDDRQVGDIDITSEDIGNMDELRVEGRGLSAKRQRMNPSFGVNVMRANTFVSDSQSSPSPGAGTFSGPPSSASSTTPSGASFANVDVNMGYNHPHNPKSTGMSITIPSASFHSPRSTSRLMSSALAHAANPPSGAGPPGTGHIRTLARARSDSAPHGVGLGNLWRVNVNGPDALAYSSYAQQQLPQVGVSAASVGRPRSGTHHPYPLTHHHSRSSFSGGAGGVSRSPSLASIGSGVEPSMLTPQQQQQPQQQGQSIQLPMTIPQSQDSGASGTMIAQQSPA